MDDVDIVDIGQFELCLVVIIIIKLSYSPIKVLFSKYKVDERERKMYDRFKGYISTRTYTLRYCSRSVQPSHICYIFGLQPT